MTNILGIFAKQPTPGQVKTRLAAATSPAFAAQVAEAMLRDTLDRLATINAERWLVFAPSDADAEMARYAQGRFQLASQGDGDLGQRLQRFFQARIRGKTERVVVVGADSPTLPITFIDEAFRELAWADVVLGPATDGGYCLLGCARNVPPIFDGIAWSGAAVLRDTIARLHESSKIALLPPWYDVDTLEDWRMLQGHIAALRRAGRDPGAPRTERQPAPA